MANDKRIGALWEKTSKNGSEMITGYIEVDGQRVDIICFRNQYKEQNQKAPDWNVLESRPYEGKSKSGYKPRETVPPDDEEAPF